MEGFGTIPTRLESHIVKKLEKTGTTLVDLLMVAKTIDAGEAAQIEAFGGTTDPERIAVTILQAAAFMWTAREIDSGEPLAVGGYVQTGPTIFRSFFLANPRVWEEHPREITEMARDTIEEIKGAFEYVRLETLCLSTRPRQVPEWYEKIGLKYDATLEGFGVKGQDALLYSAVGKAGEQRIQLAAANGVN